MKKVTWNGSGNLVLPGHDEPLTPGASGQMSDKDAEALIKANPGLEVTIEDAPDNTSSSTSK